MSVNTSGLLERVASGDEAAVRECIDRYSPLVWTIARRILGAAPEVEDAVQEVFLELWKSAGRFDPNIAAEQTFVAMVARRRTIDRKRRASRRRDSAASTPIDEIDVAEDERPDSVETADEVGRVRAALARLPQQQRRVLRLAVVESWSHAEISERLSLPLGTVKSQVRRGLIRIREMLGQQAEGRVST